MPEDWIWVKADTKITFLVLHKTTFKCEHEGCNRETHLTSHGNYGGEPGIGHPLCEEHYKELHAYHVRLVERDKEKGGCMRRFEVTEGETARDDLK